MTVEREQITKTNERDRQRKTQFSVGPVYRARAQATPLVQLQRNLGNEAFGLFLQAKLEVNQPGDVYEQEADRVAEEVMRMREPTSHDVSHSSSPTIQRKCAACASGEGLCPQYTEEEKMIQRKPLAAQITALIQRQTPEEPEEEEEETVQTKEVAGATPAITPSVESHINSMRDGGQPLPESLRAFFEPRFGADFGGVRVHTDARASELARAVNARAFTVRQDVVFGAGEYAPESKEGQRLMAHELTHVVQQNQHIIPEIIQRQCGDPDFCTPYATTAEAISEEAWLRTYFLPAMQAKFGTEVHDLWESFLSRASGASLARRVFDTPGNPIEDSFATSSAVEDDQEAVLDLVVSRLSRFPGGRLSPHVHTVASLTNFLSASEMNDRPINFSNPLSKAGNIAGGIGSSAAGPDFRKIARANVTLEKVPLVGNSGYIDFELFPHYEVYDAVDLCPGQCGSPAEQVFTIPLSRLEASGRAFDVPYVVKFQPEPETRKEFYSSLPL